MRKVALDGERLDPTVLEDVLSGREIELALAPEARERIARSREVLERVASGPRAVYGVNTGFGKLASVRIAPADRDRLQTNLVRSHACGVGPALPRPIAAAALLLRIHALAHGASGVRVTLVERLIELFNRGLVPVVPSQGSVGASGDLAPLAHIALALLGEGEVDDGRGSRRAAEALHEAGVEPFALAAKEGIALINGTQVSTALLAAALFEAETLARTADCVAAATLEALKGSVVPFDERIHRVRPHRGHGEVSANFRRLLAGSGIVESHKDCPRVQDNYSLRCIPQVHGAVRDALRFVRQAVEVEIDSVTDNPLVFAQDGAVLSGGNFHGEPVAIPADVAKIAVAELGTISERRIDYLVNPDLSGLPPFLAGSGGLESGLMIPQVVAASLASENKVLAHPASVDTIPTSGGKEDHVSFSTTAARQALSIVANVRRILAIECLAACQGLELETTHLPGPGVLALHRAVRKLVQPLAGDRPLSQDIETLAAWIASGGAVQAVQAEIGNLE